MFGTCSLSYVEFGTGTAWHLAKGIKENYMVNPTAFVRVGSTDSAGVLG